MPQRRGVQTLDKRLSRIFTNPRVGGSFGGLDTLWRAVNKDGVRRYISRERVRKWLRDRRPYTLHRQPKRRFQRRKVVVSGINDQWQADLVDVSSLASSNDKHTFILTVIDVFSKVGYAQPLRNKEARSITNAFKTILSTNGDKKPLSIQTDKGKEFRNKHFQTWADDQGIKLFTSEDDQMKSQIVERWNRTLKNKMYRLFEHKGKAIWITFLQDLVHSYNNTYHTSIKMTPAQVNRENEDTVFFELYPPPTVLRARGSSAGLNVGDYVRLLNPSSVFKKGYARQWTNEVFRIRMRNLTGAFALYKVEDLHGEDIEGFFYRSELQQTIKPSRWVIDRILHSGDGKHLVRWRDRGYKDDAEVTEKDLKKFTRQ